MIVGATSLSVSSYNLVGITVVRLLALRRPLTFRLELTVRKMSLAAVAIWILAASVSTGVHFRKDEGREPHTSQLDAGLDGPKVQCAKELLGLHMHGSK